MSSAAEKLAALSGVTVEEREASYIGALVSKPNRRVEETPEFARVSSLPRRDWMEGAEALANQITESFRTEGGTLTLRDIQAAALYDLYTFEGLFGPINVGGGKTLISFLAPALVGASRPVLLIPANLKSKTEREFMKLRSHFRGPSYIRIISYEALGRVNYQNVLDTYKPDIIIADEAHKLKNKRAAVTRRVARYMKANPSTRFVALSGTITNRSLMDYAHIADWCLPKSYFLPRMEDELATWAAALDEDKSAFNRPGPGAFFHWVRDKSEISIDPLRAARKAYRERMTETPGVIATQGGALGTSLHIVGVKPEPERCKEIDEALGHMREYWETPDGHPIADAIQFWRHAREISCGFYYRWNPRPPDDWLNARKDWAAWCRETLKVNRRGLDSEFAVTLAVDKGLYPEGIPLLEEWRKFRPLFTPNVECVWLSSVVLDFAEQWMKHHPRGIVWTEHARFAKALEAYSGVTYYGRKGLSSNGVYIEDHPEGSPIIASIHSNREGRNLQYKWFQNLIISSPPPNFYWEQVLGRTHRPGQEEDTVYADVLYNCYEAVAGFEQACKDAAYTQITTGQDQKLCYADVDFPSTTDLATLRGSRWHK